MTLTLNRILLTVAVVLSLLSVMFATMPSVHAQDNAKTDACTTLGEISGGSVNTDCNTTSGKSVEGLLRLVVNLISIVAGVIAVIVLIVSGLKYMTSQGDSASVSSAKRSLIYAVIGIMVAALAQVIVRFVLGRTA